MEQNEQKNDIDNTWSNEVDKLCKKAIQSLENTHEVTVNIGKSAVNCLAELHNQSDTICRINQMVNTAIGSLNDTAKCLKDMASPVTCIISGIYDDYVAPNDNSNATMAKESAINAYNNIAADSVDNGVNAGSKDEALNNNKCSIDKNGVSNQEIHGDGILTNFSKTSCNKLDQIIDQLEFNKGATEELVKALDEDKQKLGDTVNNVMNLQDKLSKVQSSMSNT